MVAWTSVPLAIAVVAVVLLGPGLLVGRAARLRGLLLLGSAAPLSVTVIAVSAVVAPWVGVRWDWRVPAVGTIVLGLVVALLRRLVWPTDDVGVVAAHAVLADDRQGAHRAARSESQPATQPARQTSPPRAAASVRLPSPRGGLPAEPADPTEGPVVGGSGPFLVLAGIVGALTGGVAIAATIHRAIWSPSLIAQAYDIVFHLNGVRYILNTGDASSLHLGRLTSPHTTVPYPAAWHDVVSLVVQLSGSSILVATNVTALVVCALIWPLSAVTLVAQLLPRSPWVVAAAGLLTAAFPAFPTLLLIWGVLYPTLLGYAMIPAALALLLAVLTAARRSSVESSRAVLAAGRTGTGLGTGPGTGLGLCLLGVEAVGLTFAHPSVLFALLVLAGPMLAVVGGRWVWRTGRGPRPAPAVAGVVGVIVLVLAVAVAIARSSVIAGMSHYSWPATASVPQALGEAAFGATPSGAPGEADGALWAATLAWIGIVVTLRRRYARWLVAAFAGAGVLYVVGETTSTNVLTGVWYNDAYRLAPLLTIVSVPLAAIGLDAAARGARRLVGGGSTAGSTAGSMSRSTSRPTSRPPRGRRGAPLAVVAAVVPVVIAIVAVLAPGSGRGPATTRLRTAYELGSSNVSPLASANELALYRRLPAEVPAGAVIANDPYDGSSLVMGLADRTPLFTHFTGAWTPRQRLIAAHLDRVATDPKVCAAVRAEHVTYLLAEGKRYFDWLPRAAWFDGIRAAPDTSAFTLVDHVGDARLYRLTSCAGAPGA